MSNATGSNSGPNKAGRPANDADAIEGTTSGQGPDWRKMGKSGKPEKGSLEQSDS